MLGISLGSVAEAAAKLDDMSKRVEQAVDQALHQEALLLHRTIVQGIREQAPGGQKFLPLSPATLAIRRFRGFSATKALIVTGDLRNSVRVVKDKDGYFVGVHRTAKNRKGESLANVAAIHEYGAGPFTIEITPKMRRFLMAAFRAAGLNKEPPSGGSKDASPASKAVLVIKIPPRPFLRPSFDSLFKDEKAVQKRVLQRVGKLLGLKT